MVAKVLTFESEVKVVWNLTDTVRMLILTVPDNFNHIPGQFASIIFHDEQGEEIRRPYSIASEVKSDHTIDLCIKIVEHGKASHYVSTLKTGDRIKLMGPMGRFMIPEQKQDQDIVFISTGTGIAPFRAMIRSRLQAEKKQQMYLFTGYRYEDEALYKEELESLMKKHHNFT